MKRALIFGASGQAGSYLCDLLVAKGYDVSGTYYRGEIANQEVDAIQVDLTDDIQIARVIRNVEPDEVYNLAAEMFAPRSWEHPGAYFRVNALAVVQMLDTLFGFNPKARFFQAGSADVFDQVYPLNEDSPIRPRSPYGVSKAAAQELVRIYREEKQRFACTGILFNMESPRRPDTFFSVKVAKAVARIFAEEQEKLVLGQLHAQRDWGYTEEYVEAMWLMLQAKEPKDYVIGTGEVHSCLDFVKEAFSAVGWVMGSIEPHFEWDRTTPITEDIFVSDPRKIREDLGWYARTKFSGLVRHLVVEEMKKLGQSIVTR